MARISWARFGSTSSASALAAMLAAAVVALPPGVSAQKGRMRLLVSNGVKAALVAVQPACETQTGVAWDAEYGTSNTNASAV